MTQPQTLPLKLVSLHFSPSPLPQLGTGYCYRLTLSPCFFVNSSVHGQHRATITNGQPSGTVESCFVCFGGKQNHLFFPRAKGLFSFFKWTDQWLDFKGMAVLSFQPLWEYLKKPVGKERMFWHCFLVGAFGPSSCSYFTRSSQLCLL